MHSSSCGINQNETCLSVPKQFVHVSELVRDGTMKQVLWGEMCCVGWATQNRRVAVGPPASPATPTLKGAVTPAEVTAGTPVPKEPRELQSPPGRGLAPPLGFHMRPVHPHPGHEEEMGD